MSRSTLITAIGEALYIDDQSKYSQKIQFPTFKTIVSQRRFPRFPARGTHLLSPGAKRCSQSEPRLAPLQRLELTTIKGPLKRWRASVDHPSPRQHNMKVKN